MTIKYTKSSKIFSRRIKEENGEWQSKVYKRTVYKTNPNWKKIKAAVLFRDCFRCVRCETGKDRRFFTAHHIIPRSEGGEDYIENLVTLCPTCHDFVEIENLRTLVDIIASYDLPNREEEDEPFETVEEDKFERPEWHKYVYGGVRHSN